MTIIFALKSHSKERRRPSFVSKVLQVHLLYFFAAPLESANVDTRRPIIIASVVLLLGSF